MAETSVYELARMTHEEIEQYEDALVDTLISPPYSSSQRLRVQWQLVASQLLDKIVRRYESLSEMYADHDQEREREWEKLGRQEDGDNENGPFAAFYARLQKLHDYYRRYPENAVVPQTSATPSMFATGDVLMSDLSTLEREFSGEEMGGRFLDLYIQYEMFINLKGVQRIGYLDYLARLDQTLGESVGISMSTKRTEAYSAYLSSLRHYLSSFLHKTRPLEDMDAVEIKAVEHFEHDWERGRVPGWERREENLYGATSAASAAEGIWCDVCQRSYAKQTVYDAHLQSARHRKLKDAVERGERVAAREQGQPHASPFEQAKRIARAKAMARDEVLVQALATVLAPVRDDTCANVERKAALTDRERQEEADAIEAENEEALATGGMGYEQVIEREMREPSQRTYNPLKLPLGWDGKPIPFWMYKLHGLSVEFKCEICSDHVYRGRKIFEKHFQEARHSFGMRALGIPNLPQFRDVTRIQDAYALWDKINKLEKKGTIDDGDTEEIEDEHGNAYTRKTYELLKRQGLL